MFSTPAGAAPQASAQLSHTRVSLNKPFELLLMVTWEGPADEYVIVPPAPVLPESVELQTSSMEATARGQTQLLTYRFILKALKKGAFEISPMEVKYWQRESDQERITQTERIAFEAVRLALPGSRTLWISVAAGAGLLVVLGAGVLIAGRRTRRKNKTDTASQTSRELLAEQLQQCRQCKIQGDYRGFYEAAAELAGMLMSDDPAFTGMLGDTLEQVRFGGFQPTTEEVDRILRQLEKRVGGKTVEKADQELEISKYCR